VSPQRAGKSPQQPDGFEVLVQHVLAQDAAHASAAELRELVCHVRTRPRSVAYAQLSARV